MYIYNLKFRSSWDRENVFIERSRTQLPNPQIHYKIVRKNTQRSLSASHMLILLSFAAQISNYSSLSPIRNWETKICRNRKSSYSSWQIVELKGFDVLYHKHEHTSHVYTHTHTNKHFIQLSSFTVEIKIHLHFFEVVLPQLAWPNHQHLPH